MNWCKYSWTPGGHPPKAGGAPPKAANPRVGSDPGAGGFAASLLIGDVLRERERGLTYVPPGLLCRFSLLSSLASCENRFPRGGDSPNEAVSGLDLCVRIPGGGPKVSGNPRATWIPGNPSTGMSTPDPAERPGSATMLI